MKIIFLSTSKFLCMYDGLRSIMGGKLSYIATSEYVEEAERLKAVYLERYKLKTLDEPLYNS